VLRATGTQVRRAVLCGVLLSLGMVLGGCGAAGTEWSTGPGGGGGGGDGGGGGIPNALVIRPIVSDDIVFSVGSAFQLHVTDYSGKPAIGLQGSFFSLDSTVIAVSPDGWAEARATGNATILYGGPEMGTPANTVFFVGTPPATSSLRLEIHGTSRECDTPLSYACAPAGSPIVDGWIGHSIDVRDVSLDFVGANGLQATDQVTASPVAPVPCQDLARCVSLAVPGPAHTWAPGETTLCIGVAVGDSVPEQEWSGAASDEWEVVWSRPGLFVLRKQFYIFVRPRFNTPATGC